MADLLIKPPVLFIILFSCVALGSLLLSRLAFRGQKRAEGAGKPYACGEEAPDRMVQPDYGQFFPFAFYFTILHVVALFITMVPAVTGLTLWISVIYIIGAIIGLFILLEK